MSYSLPFIAHERLFELYPVHGSKYSGYDELRATVERAGSSSATEYRAFSGLAKGHRAVLAMKILLLHHTRYHFETLISFAHILRGSHEVRIWSNFLGPEQRHALVKDLGLDTHEQGAEYDFVILITGDERKTLSEIDGEIRALLDRTRTFNVMHRFNRTEATDCIYLSPRASRPVIMSSTGIRFAAADCEKSANEVRLLIQGNFQKSRRDYDRVATLTESAANVAVDIVGRWWEGERPSGPRINVHSNLPEAKFHNLCAKAHFIVPLIDPEQHPQYFSTTFPSSILIGLSYSLPFIAHERLFELYPIHGFKYSGYDQLPATVERAANISATEYDELAAKMSDSRELLIAKNLENLVSYFK